MSSSAFKSKSESSSLDVPFQPSRQLEILSHAGFADEPWKDSCLRPELSRRSWGSDVAAYGGGGDDLTVRRTRPGGRGRGVVFTAPDSIQG